MPPLRLSPEDAEIVARHRREQRESQAESFVTPCEKHPNWHVDVSRGQPRPVWPSCPLCASEEIADRDRPRSSARKLDTSAAFPRDDRYLKWLEREPARAGTFEEQNALDAIATLRDDDAAREASRDRSGLPKGSRLVSARSEENIWVEFWAIPGRGIVKRSAAA